MRRNFVRALALGLVCLAANAWADTLSFVSGAGQSGLIGTTGAQPLVVELRDVNGGVIAGRNISWSTSNGFLVSAPTSVTNANGQATITFTYGNYGTTNILVSEPITGATASAPETSVGSDSIVLISGGGQVGQAGAASAQPIVVELRNAAGAPVSGRTVNWADQTAYTQVNAATSLTNASGRASMGFNFLAGPAASSGSPAGIQATNSVGGQSVTATVTEIGGNLLTITSALQVTGLVGQTSPPIVAHVADWQGNPIAGATVNWSAALAGVFVLSSASTVTDAAGNTSITADYVGSTGDDIITAGYNGTSADVHFYLHTQTYMSALSPNPIIGSPNTASATPMVIQDFNKDGTPRVGDTVTWTVQSGDAVPNAPTSVTDATGTASMGFTFGTLLTQFLATDSRGVSKGLLVDPSVSGQAVQLVSGVGQSGASQTAAASPMVMKVVNEAGVPQPGVTVNWSQYANGTFGFEGNVVYTSPTTTVSDAAGLVQATFNFGAVGKVAIRAELVSTLGMGATVTSFGTETLAVLSGEGQSGLVGTTSAQPIVVVFRDPAGNPLAGQTINWSIIAGGNAILDAATSVTNAGGQASMGFTYGATASTNQIQAAGTSPNPVSGPILAAALVTGVGADSLSIISGNGQVGAPNSAGAQPFVVEQRDAAGNPVVGATIQWSTSVPPGSAVCDAPTSLTDANGRASMTFTYGSGGVSSQLVANNAALQQVQFTVSTSEILNHAVIVSGNGQSGQPGSAGAQPIVVELRDASNAPQVGENAAWRVVSGPATLGANTTVTDGNGRVQTDFNFGTSPGSSIIEAYDPSDPVNGQRVQATVTALGDIVSLVNLPSLTPEQEAVAVVLDNACPALADLSSPSPEQADLLARCQELSAASALNPSTTASALDELLTKTAETQATAASVAVGAQIQNINARLITLRSGGGGSSSKGLTFTGSGGSIPLFSLLQTLADVEAPQAGDNFSRWGFFASGNIGRGEVEANDAAPAYDYDIDGVTVGVDYRQRDNWVFGAALGYSRQDTTLADQQGDAEMSGWSLSAYSTYSFKELWYLDSVLIFGHNSFDLNRRIRYILPTVSGGTTSIDQVANGEPGGGLFSAALTFGGDFNSKAWAFSPYGQVIYSRMDFDAYEENLRAGPGIGLGLAVEERQITSLTGILGARLSYTYSASWGVFAPLASVEFDHEFKSDAEAITARFLYDPTQTPFSVAGAPIDSSYMRLGLGLTMVFTHGKSGFLLFQRLLAREGQSQDNLSLGVRIEF